MRSVQGALISELWVQAKIMYVAFHIHSLSLSHAHISSLSVLPTVSEQSKILEEYHSSISLEVWQWSGPVHTLWCSHSTCFCPLSCPSALRRRGDVDWHPAPPLSAPPPFQLYRSAARPARSPQLQPLKVTKMCPWIKQWPTQDCLTNIVYSPDTPRLPHLICKSLPGFFNMICMLPG